MDNKKLSIAYKSRPPKNQCKNIGQQANFSQASSKPNMVKQHGGNRGSTQARPLQGILLLVLIILTTAVHVVAVNLDIGEAIDSGLSKTLGMFKDKQVPKKLQPYLKGARTGSRSYRYGKRAYNSLSGSTPVMPIDTVQVPGSPPARLQVATADLTTKAAAQALCATAKGAGVNPADELLGPIKLLGRQGTTDVLNLPRATFIGCPAGGSSSALIGLAWGGELVPRSRIGATTFSYLVKPQQGPGGETISYIAVAWFGPAPQGSQQGRWTPLVRVWNPSNSLYHVKVTNILIAGVDITQQAPPHIGLDATGSQTYGTSFVAYLSTTDDALSLLPPGIYHGLKAELVGGLFPNTAPAPGQKHPDQLCYYKQQSITSKLAVPAIAIDIVFEGGATLHQNLANLFLSVAQFDCLSILPTTAGASGGVPVLGSALQSGKTMTIQVADGGGTMQGTVTF